MAQNLLCRSQRYALCILLVRRGSADRQSLPHRFLGSKHVNWYGGHGGCVPARDEQARTAELQLKELRPAAVALNLKLEEIEAQPEPKV